MKQQFIQNMWIDWNKIDADSYLRDIPALQFEDELVFDNNITFFVGENGTGKSTLLEAIAVAYGFSAEGGSRNYSFSTYDSHSELHNAVTLGKGFRKPAWSYFLRTESFYNVASQAEEYRQSGLGAMSEEAYYEQYGGKSFHNQSHGESFLGLLQGTLRSDGIYILDEPEAALSPQRQLTLLIKIAKMAKEGAQFIIATHSPILLGIPDADIISFDDGVLHRCEYTQTESYQVMEMFINNREYFLKRLLRE